MPQFALEPLHRCHTYCARFPSEIVEAMLERDTTPGQRHRHRCVGGDAVGGQMRAACARTRCRVACPICRPTGERLQRGRTGLETPPAAMSGDDLVNWVTGTTYSRVSRIELLVSTTGDCGIGRHRGGRASMSGAAP